MRKASQLNKDLVCITACSALLQYSVMFDHFLNVAPNENSNGDTGKTLEFQIMASYFENLEYVKIALRSFIDLLVFSES